MAMSTMLIDPYLIHWESKTHNPYISYGNLEYWGPFLEGPEKFSHPESGSKISKIMITELFYSRILNINRGSLHTRGFRRIHFSISATDELKMALRARKAYGAFEKRAPGVVWANFAPGAELFSP